MTCPNEQELSLHAEGELTANATAAIGAHVADCEACKASLASRNALVAQIAGAYATTPGPSFAAEVLQRLPAPSAPKSFSWIAARVTVAIALGTAVTTLLPVPGGEWAPRGGATPYAHRLGIETKIDGERLVPGMLIKPDTGFTFTVYNRSEADLALMIFAIDAAGAVHWFYPAFVDPHSDPSSRILDGRSAITPLEEGVRPEGLAPGPIQLVSIFSDDPLHVRAIEAELAETGIEGLQAAHPSAVIRAEAFEVSR
jgi:hypothetical protein